MKFKIITHSNLTIHHQEKATETIPDSMEVFEENTIKKDQPLGTPSSMLSGCNHEWQLCKFLCKLEKRRG